MKEALVLVLLLPVFALLAFYAWSLIYAVWYHVAGGDLKSAAITAVVIFFMFSWGAVFRVFRARK